MRAIARWNPARDVWESEAMDLFSGLSDVYSGIFPTSGSMRSGQVFERPTSAPLTDGSESSSPPGLLPTPESSDATGGRVTAQLGGRRPSGAKRAITLATRLAHLPTLLPTPAACVANDGESTETWLARRERVKLTAANGNGMGMPLTIAVQLLGEPTGPLSDAGSD